MRFTEAVGLPKTDDEGCRTLARFSGFQWLGAFLRLGLERREVPVDHWTAQGSDEDGDWAAVSCVCGGEARVPLAVYPTHCECERWFFYDGTDVWSLLGPVRQQNRSAAA